MNDFFQDSVFFGASISIISYGIGMLLQRKFKLPFLNPLLISIVITVVVLIVGHIDYDTYYVSAKYLSYLLTPATVCLAVPLYEKFDLLKKNLKAVSIGITSGVITSLCSILVMAVFFKLNHEEYVTFLPKSITTAIGMGLSEELGGMVSVTVASIIVTGLFGNVAAAAIFKLFRIKHPVAIGVSCGTGAHAMGTSRAREFGEIEEAMSGLSIAVCGLLTVVGASIFAMIQF